MFPGDRSLELRDPDQPVVVCLDRVVLCLGDVRLVRKEEAEALDQRRRRVAARARKPVASVCPVCRALGPRWLLEENDGGHAAVAVTEDELHEPLAGGEPARARPAPELEARLRHRRPHDERVERPGRNLDLLDSDHLGRAVDAEGREVAARILRSPASARRRGTPSDSGLKPKSIRSNGVKKWRRFVDRQRLRTERRELARVAAFVSPQMFVTPSVRVENP